MNDYAERNHKARPYEQQLEMAFHELEGAQDDVTAERVHDEGVSPQTHRALEQAVMKFRRRLLPFVDKNSTAAEIWEQYYLDSIPQECARRTGVTEGTVSHFGMKSGGGDSIVEHASIGNLMVWADALVKVYAELGFAPEMEIPDHDSGGGEAV